MAALPENWEMDYDGAISRWIYRFKPTGLIQYTFPKPGDEFPEYVGNFGGPMSPEDKFTIQKLKKGGAGSENTPASCPFNIITTAASASFSGSSYKTPPPWFQPDDFMYMDPSPYNDTTPKPEEDEAQLPATDPKTPESKVTRPPTRPFISPVTSTENTPRISNNRVSVLTIPEQSTPARLDSAPTTGDTIQSPVVPMLDGRPINQTFPIGFVAELYGESSARPREEHPAAAELPGHEAPIRNIQSAKSDQHAPVELSSESISLKATSGNRSKIDKKAGLPNPNGKKESSTFILGANFASGPSNPAPARPPKHPIQEQAPARVEIPAGSSEEQTPEKTKVDEDQGKTEPGAELGSDLNVDGQADKVLAQRVPSVLQPARGRPKPLKSASEGQQAPSTANRSVQRPLYDLPELEHRNIKPRHGHQSMILLNDKDVLDPPPSFTRTNTLPADMPSLPFMGNGFSSKTKVSSPAPKPHDQPASPPPASSEEEPQMGFNFASTTRPHRGSLSDYANPVLPDIGQSVKPLNITRKPSPTEFQGVVNQSSSAVKDNVEQATPVLDEELAQAMREFDFRPHYEAQGATAIPGSAPPRPEKIPLDSSQPTFTPYRPPVGDQPIRRKPVAQSNAPHEISTSNMEVEQQGDPFNPLGYRPLQGAQEGYVIPPLHEQHPPSGSVETLPQPDIPRGIPPQSMGVGEQGGSFAQPGTQECYVLPPSHEQQPPSWSAEALPQPDAKNAGIPQTFPAQQHFANSQPQMRASTWPKPDPTAVAFDSRNDDLASKPLPPVPQVMTQSMPQARGLQSEASSPVVKEKRGLLSKFRRTGNTGNSSSKLQKSAGNSYPTASTSVPQPQHPVSYPSHPVASPPQQSPPQNSQAQFQNSSSPPNQAQIQGYNQWPANTLDTWSAYGHRDPRTFTPAFTPTIQLGGPQHEPEFVYQSQPMSAQQQWNYHQQQQEQQPLDNRRESQVSNLTGTSSPSPVPSNADTVSIADSSRVSIISSHHTRPGSDGTASVASVSTIGRNSVVTPPRSGSFRSNGPGPSRWGSVSGGTSGGGGQYDGSGWGDFE